MMATRSSVWRNGDALQQAARELPAETWLDLDAFPLAGVEGSTYPHRIRIKGKYPQFLYWLAMPFFAPVPRKPTASSRSPAWAAKNLTLDWWPVGNRPLHPGGERSQSPHGARPQPQLPRQTYPAKANPETGLRGLLEDCGQPLPFVDAAVFTSGKGGDSLLEQVSSGVLRRIRVSPDKFRPGGAGQCRRRRGPDRRMRGKGIRLLTSVKASTFYGIQRRSTRWLAAWANGAPSCARPSPSP